MNDRSLAEVHQARRDRLAAAESARDEDRLELLEELYPELERELERQVAPPGPPRR